MSDQGFDELSRRFDPKQLLNQDEEEIFLNQRREQIEKNFDKMTIHPNSREKFKRKVREHLKLKTLFNPSEFFDELIDEFTNTKGSTLTKGTLLQMAENLTSQEYSNLIINKLNEIIEKYCKGKDIDKLPIYNDLIKYNYVNLKLKRESRLKELKKKFKKRPKLIEEAEMQLVEKKTLDVCKDILVTLLSQEIYVLIDMYVLNEKKGYNKKNKTEFMNMVKIFWDCTGISKLAIRDLLRIIFGYYSLTALSKNIELSRDRGKANLARFIGTHINVKERPKYFETNRRKLIVFLTKLLNIQSQLLEQTITKTFFVQETDLDGGLIKLQQLLDGFGQKKKKQRKKLKTKKNKKEKYKKKKDKKTKKKTI